MLALWICIWVVGWLGTTRLIIHLDEDSAPWLLVPAMFAWPALLVALAIAFLCLMVARLVMWDWTIS